MDKIIGLVIITFCYIMINLLIASEGQTMSFARFQMPAFLRKILFFLPRKYHKFSLHGMMFSLYTHILLIVSVIRVVFESDNWSLDLDPIINVWGLSCFLLIIILEFDILGYWLFGEKKCIKKTKVKQALYKNEFIKFDEFKVIKEAVISENIRYYENGVVLMLPTSMLINYNGTAMEECKDEDYIGTCGNYELMSAFFYEKGYSTIRMNFEQNIEQYGYYTYVEEVKKMLKILEEKYKFGNDLMLFAHGPIGSVVALDVSNDILVSKIIMFGGANVTPFEDLYQHLKFDRLVCKESEMFEGQMLFGQEIFSIRGKDALEKIKAISVPTLVVFTSEELFYNLELVKELEQINNPNVVVKRLFGVAGVWAEYDLSKCTYRNIEVRNDKVLNLCKRVKKILGEWIDNQT